MVGCSSVLTLLKEEVLLLQVWSLLVQLQSASDVHDPLVSSLRRPLLDHDDPRTPSYPTAPLHRRHPCPFYLAEGFPLQKTYACRISHSHNIHVIFSHHQGKSTGRVHCSTCVTIFNFIFRISSCPDFMQGIVTVLFQRVCWPKKHEREAHHVQVSQPANCTKKRKKPTQRSEPPSLPANRRNAAVLLAGILAMLEVCIQAIEQLLLALSTNNPACVQQRSILLPSWDQGIDFCHIQHGFGFASDGISLQHISPSKIKVVHALPCRGRWIKSAFKYVGKTRSFDLLGVG